MHCICLFPVNHNSDDCQGSSNSLLTILRIFDDLYSIFITLILPTLFFTIGVFFFLIYIYLIRRCLKVREMPI